MMDSQKRWWDFPAALLLLVALWTSVIRLSATEWTQQLNYLELLVLIGFGLGVLLGQSNFSKKQVLWFSIAYSIIFIPWQLVRTMEGEILWSERFLSLLGRLGASVSLFLDNQPIQDPVLFLGSMAVLFWGISLSAGYLFTRRGNPWIPVLISGLILLIVDFYNPILVNRGRYSGVFVLVVILLAGRIYFLENQKKWGEHGIAVDSETGSGMGKSVVISALLIVVLAWNIPVFVEVFTPGTVARNKASQSWDWIRERFENAFVSLQGNTVKVSDFYGNDLALGSGTAMGNETVFNVEASTTRSPGLRFYWRGNTYDYYENGNWSNRFSIRKSINPDEWPLELVNLSGKKRVDFTFEMGASLQIFYIPAVPVSVSRPARYVAQDAENNKLDVVALLTEQVLRPGEVFQAASLVSVPTIMELKSAGEEYPEWVTKRYLQLPENFSERIVELAKEIAADAETPYDKANAITEYLRNEITYVDMIDAPPVNQDPIEWFLFDYKKGFCNYYATSEVLMLRAVGVPARMVAGFAQGEVSDKSNEYRVRIKDSHAWPEVYFPGIGWMEFEPTVSQPEIKLREGIAGTSSSGEGPDLIRNGELQGEISEEDPLDAPVLNDEGGLLPDGTLSPKPYRWILISVGVLFASVLLWFAFRKFRSTGKVLRVPAAMEKYMIRKGFEPPRWLVYLARWTEITPMERMIYQVRWMLRVLGIKLERGLTAQDQMNLLCEVLPETSEDAEKLLREFHLATFSNHEADFRKARAAQLRLWGKIWRARARSLLGSV